jgi:putative ABC transport system ATP-binding protein
LELFDELHAGGRTIVLITHEPDVAARAGRVVRIRDGMLVADAADAASAEAMARVTP